MLNYRLHNNVRGAKKGYSLIVVVKYMGGGRGGGGIEQTIRTAAMDCTHIEKCNETNFTTYSRCKYPSEQSVSTVNQTPGKKPGE